MRKERYWEWFPNAAFPVLLASSGFVLAKFLAEIWDKLRSMDMAKQDSAQGGQNTTV